MRFSVFWVCLLVCTGLFSAGLWLSLRKRRSSRSVDFADPVQRGRPLATAHKILLTKLNTLPPGFDRKFEAGIYPLSQVVAAAFETFPSSPGLYAVTFSPKTLAALRSGHAHLMHSVNGDRAIAVELNGKVKEIPTVASGFDPLRACLATASLVTGQYFLARIDAKLNAILTNVQDILRLLDSAERAKLNLATSYLQFLINAARQGRCFEHDEIEIRTHRAECLLIAERNLVTLEDKMAPSESRKALGAKERLGELSDDIANWLTDKSSVLMPSAREEGLLTETKDFAKEMTRGLVALQASLCFEAILEPLEASSPTGMQVLSIKVRFRAVWEKFQTQFHEKKNVALQDWRYWEAEEKRQRFEQELNSLLGPVNKHWEVLEELETQWKHRAVGVPESFYVEVNEAGHPLQFFLPDV